ncbi:MAG: hypothetical protein E7617_01070 [Ruminococcaceae bacterium]|nr:hypothetical protein [Oscillospiraceae bacterium]
MIFAESHFIKALPVWECGMQKELNHALRFVADVRDYSDALLRISGHTGYQVFINGRFIHYGPARAGRGYYRVDELDVGKYLTRGENRILILASGYFCDSFEWLKEPSFIIAELVSDGKVVAFTGGEGWKAYSYSKKIRKVQRYSYQRPFAEVYDMSRHDVSKEVELEICGEKKFIEREISYPEFPRESVCEIYGGGSVTHIKPEKYYDRREVVNAGKTVDGFAPEETEIISIHKAEELKLCPDGRKPSFPTVMNSDTYISASMKVNTTGFIEVKLRCLEDTELYMTFDELLVDGRVDFTRNHTSNVVLYRLKGGNEYKLITAEPYTFKYINIITSGGKIELSYVGMIRVDFNISEIKVELDSDKASAAISRIYNAAVETFRQNTFDIYMDCPSRERAGWLCDSFFTARVERLLSGKSTVEKCFLSNFAMEDSYKSIPRGMLPMCYPSDFRNPEFIPNWAMWYVLELKEYLDRTGDREFVNDLYPKMLELCKYFEAYENSNGLLERLDGWIFVEWSMCNNLVQDVNYPSNMLYYKFLKTMYELYGDEKYNQKAEKLKETIRRESKIGIFYCDNSVFKDGELTLSGERTETCQYYAFFTGVANDEEDKELWKTLVDDFGPERKETGKWKEIYPSNAFIGNYLRLELLCQNGRYDKLEENICGYFDYMASLTGTLWEHKDIKASCNHGFASHVLVWLDKLGYIKCKSGFKR